MRDDVPCDPTATATCTTYAPSRLDAILGVGAVRDVILPLLSPEQWLAVFCVSQSLRGAVSLDALLAHCTEQGLSQAARAMCERGTSHATGNFFHPMWPALAAHLCVAGLSDGKFKHPSFMRTQFTEATIASTSLASHWKRTLGSPVAVEREVMFFVRALSAIPCRRLVRQVAHSSDIVRLVKYGSEKTRNFLQDTLGLLACTTRNLHSLRLSVSRCDYAVNVHPLYERVSRRGDAVAARSKAYLACTDCGVESWTRVDISLCYTCRLCGRIQSCATLHDNHGTRPTLRDVYSYTSTVCFVRHGRPLPVLVRALFHPGHALRAKTDCSMV